MWRQAAFCAQQTFSRYQIAVAPLVFALGTIVTIRPVSTLMESATTSKNGEPKSSSKRATHSYGSPYFPQDIYYDLTTKEALGHLRTMKRDEVQEDKSTGMVRDKKLKVLESCGRKNVGVLSLVGYKGGALESQINQDRAFCIVPYTVEGKKIIPKKRAPWSKQKAEQLPMESLLLGVFDGHAHLGEMVSQYVVSELPNRLAQKLRDIECTKEQIIRSLIDTFIELDSSAPAEISGGCTASVVLQYGPKVYFANAGDSRSFLVVYRTKSKSVEIVYITREDKPELPDERDRVESMGGKVWLPLQGTSRVLYTDPETGIQSGLAMSRSIGDWEVGQFGVIPDPLVHVVDLPELIELQLQKEGESEDDIHIFAVSATDGVTDFASPEVVAHSVARSLYDMEGPHLLTTLEQLIYFSAQGWEQSKQGRYRDDISIAVAQLRIPDAPEKQ